VAAGSEADRQLFPGWQVVGWQVVGCCGVSRSADADGGALQEPFFV
jgi:hypothetical protein